MYDSLRFFQNEFTKIMSVETFTKEHQYNIRHCYGKEGKRTNYSPYSCMKIIMGAPPGPGQAHGCPYRHLDEQHLSSLLGAVNVNGAQRETVLGQVRKSNFQVACQRHFELTHPGAFSKGVNADGVGNHPNSWTQASLEYHSAASTGKVSGAGGAAEGAEDAPGFNAPPDSSSSPATAAMAVGE